MPKKRESERRVRCEDGDTKKVEDFARVAETREGAVRVQSNVILVRLHLVVPASTGVLSERYRSPDELCDLDLQSGRGGLTGKLSAEKRTKGTGGRGKGGEVGGGVSLSHAGEWH